MNTVIKTELYKLINDCDNEMILAQAKELLQANNEVKDWWDELTEEDRNLVMESEAEYSKGNFISHAELMNRFEEWKKK